MSTYIFGEIDVPSLEEDSPIPAYDVSRSMRLNPSNPVVQALYAFVGEKVDEVRRELLQEERARRAGEEARRLAGQASEIARLINEHFQAFRNRIARVRALAGIGGDILRADANGDGPGEQLVAGNEVPARIASPTGGLGHGGGSGGGGGEPPTLGPLVEPASEEDERRGRPSGGEGEAARARGGFNVEFRNLGAEEHRAKYAPDERTIYVNLDHPQVSAARGLGDTDDLAFRRLAYEVAFSEYSIALASELAARDEYLDPSDPIVDIRETINDLARRAAHLYAP